MGRRPHRKRRSSSVNIRHGIGIVVLGVVLLFIGQLVASFVQQGNWRAALFAVVVGAGLILITLYSGRRSGR